MWLYKKLREDLKTKKDMYRKWKEGQTTKDDGYRQVARKCRDGIMRAKAENELRLARDTKSNKNLFRYVSSKRQTKYIVAQPVSYTHLTLPTKA